MLDWRRVLGCTIYLGTAVAICCTAEAQSELSEEAQSEVIELPSITVEVSKQKPAARSPRKTSVSRTTVPNTDPTSPAPITNPTPPAVPMSANSGGNGSGVAPGGMTRSVNSAGILGNRSNLDTPFTISGYTEKLIKDQQAVLARDVLQNDPAVSVGVPIGHWTETFQIRGFPVTSTSFMYDGQSVGISPKWGLESFDRVEVLKGPGAVLFGVNAFSTIGGVVNFVPKRPLDYDYNSISTRFADRSSYGAQVDVSRRYGEKKEFGVRINGAYNNGAVWPDTNVLNPVGAVSMDWKPSSRFRMNFDFLYNANYNTRDLNRFSVAPGVPIPEAPSAKQNYGQPWANTNTPTAFQLLKAAYDISDNWSVNASYRHGYYAVDFLTVSMNILDDRSYRETLFLRDKSHVDSDGGQVNLKGEVHGPLSVGHELTFGTDVQQDITFQSPDYLPTFGDTPSIISYFDDPVYTARPFTPNLAEGKQFYSRVNTQYVSDVLTLPGGFVQVIGGARRIQIENTRYNPASGVQVSQIDQSKVLPLGAFLVHPAKDLTLYSSYSQGFEKGGIAGATASNSGEAMPPIASSQIEAGIKQQMFGLTTTVAAFQIDRALEYQDPVTQVFGQFGRQINNGIEASVAGEPIKGTRFILGAMALDATTKNTSNPATEGNVPIGVPLFQANAYVERDLSFAPGLTLTGGFYYAGEQYFDATNTRSISAWNHVDLGIRYRTLLSSKYTFTARFNVENVADNQYWASTYNGLSLGAPRTFKLSAQLQW